MNRTSKWLVSGLATVALVLLVAPSFSQDAPAASGDSRGSSGSGRRSNNDDRLGLGLEPDALLNRDNARFERGEIGLRHRDEAGQL